MFYCRCTRGATAAMADSALVIRNDTVCPNPNALIFPSLCICGPLNPLSRSAAAPTTRSPRAMLVCGPGVMAQGASWGWATARIGTSRVLSRRCGRSRCCRWRLVTGTAWQVREERMHVKLLDVAGVDAEYISCLPSTYDGSAKLADKCSLSRL